MDVCPLFSVLCCPV